MTRNGNVNPSRPTASQVAVFNFIYETARNAGFQPSLREIMARFGIVSPNGVACHLQTLERKGWIRRGDGSSRSVRILRKPDGSPFTGFADKE
jgi:repressor LexA